MSAEILNSKVCENFSIFKNYLRESRRKNDDNVLNRINGIATDSRTLQKCKALHDKISHEAQTRIEKINACINYFAAKNEVNVFEWQNKVNVQIDLFKNELEVEKILHESVEAVFSKSIKCNDIFK